MAGPKLIVGLGNPGEDYEFSPHNMGFAVIDEIANRNAVSVARKQWNSVCGRMTVGDDHVWLIKPQTFMNLSGVAVKEWLEKSDCRPEDLLVVADELDLPWGSLRLRERGGAAGHHGLESIIGSIHSQQFPRLRVGVRPEHPVADKVEYLISPVRRWQRREMESVAERAAEAIETILRDGMAKAMNRYNQKPPASGAREGSADEKS
jgi:PTH1 family peptidyl-tRNA hydrolase